MGPTRTGDEGSAAIDGAGRRGRRRWGAPPPGMPGVRAVSRARRVALVVGVLGVVSLLGSSVPGPATATSSFGGPSAIGLRRGIVGIAATPTGHGYWLVAADGGVFAFGDAGFHGSLAHAPLDKPIVGIAATPTGHGYWLVGADGGVFTFGDAGFLGSLGGLALVKPAVGIAATPTGHGYWLVAADGGVFAFGDAGFFGSAANGVTFAAPGHSSTTVALHRPVVGIVGTPTGHGYWLASADAGVFSFGDAGAFGSDGGAPWQAVGIAPFPSGSGYAVAFNDHRTVGVSCHFAAGRRVVPFTTGSFGRAPIVGVAGAPDGSVYWVVDAAGDVFPTFGLAP